MVKENATTVTLTGSEVTVEFDKNYTYFWVNNIGDSAIYASMKPDVTADKDGVITILSGTAAGTMHGYGADKLYLNGSGKVQVIGTYSAFCPFKVGVKGGDGSGGTSEFSAAGSAMQPVYFDADGRPVAISHTIEADVPSGAVFTDTKYDDTGISNRVAEVEKNLGGHTVKSDVPENAVFTDTVYNDTAVRKLISDLTNYVGTIPSTASSDDVVAYISELISGITLDDIKDGSSYEKYFIQSGTFSATAAGPKTVTFPKSYSSAPIVIGVYIPKDTDDNSNWRVGACNPVTVTKTSVTLTYYRGSSFAAPSTTYPATYMWIAIGKV